MSKKIIIVIMIIVVFLFVSESYGKYKLSTSARIFSISAKPEEKTTISGNVTTKNISGIHKAIITLYKTEDTRIENDSLNPRQVISQIETNDDGSFIIEIENIESYDIVITKPGYLVYKMTDILVTDKQDISIGECRLLAGDVISFGKINLLDYSCLKAYLGVTESDDKWEEAKKCDFNGDGVIDIKDQNILYENYEQSAKPVKWNG